MCFNIAQPIVLSWVDTMLFPTIWLPQSVCSFLLARWGKFVMSLYLLLRKRHRNGTSLSSSWPQNLEWMIRQNAKSFPQAFLFVRWLQWWREPWTLERRVPFRLTCRSLVDCSLDVWILSITSWQSYWSTTSLSWNRVLEFETVACSYSLLTMLTPTKLHSNSSMLFSVERFSCIRMCNSIRSFSNQAVKYLIGRTARLALYQ